MAGGKISLQVSVRFSPSYTLTIPTPHPSNSRVDWFTPTCEYATSFFQSCLPSRNGKPFFPVFHTRPACQETKVHEGREARTSTIRIYDIWVASRQRRWRWRSNWQRWREREPRMNGMSTINESCATELFYRTMGRRIPKSETKLVAAVLFYGACGCSARKSGWRGLKENRIRCALAAFILPSRARRIFGIYFLLKKRINANSTNTTRSIRCIFAFLSRKKEIQKNLLNKRV